MLRARRLVHSLFYIVQKPYFSRRTNTKSTRIQQQRDCTHTLGHKCINRLTETAPQRWLIAPNTATLSLNLLSVRFKKTVLPWQPYAGCVGAMTCLTAKPPPLPSRLLVFLLTFLLTSLFCLWNLKRDPLFFYLDWQKRLGLVGFLPPQRQECDKTARFCNSAHGSVAFDWELDVGAADPPLAFPVWTQ